MIGTHLIKTYSRQQKQIALSSAEAQLYALVAASAEAMGLVAYAYDLGIALKPTVHTDASAALGIAQRRGLGKVRHVRTQALWIQQAHADKTLGYCKVPGTDNPSDVLTKHVPSEILDRHIAKMNLKVEEGRAERAPGINSLEIYDCSEGESIRVRTQHTIKNIGERLLGSNQ